MSDLDHPSENNECLERGKAKTSEMLLIDGRQESQQSLEREYGDVRIKVGVTNRPKPGKPHTGDFAAVTLEDTPENGVSFLAYCVDGITSSVPEEAMRHGLPQWPADAILSNRLLEGFREGSIEPTKIIEDIMQQLSKRRGVQHSRPRQQLVYPMESGIFTNSIRNKLILPLARHLQAETGDYRNNSETDPPAEQFTGVYSVAVGKVTGDMLVFLLMSSGDAEARIKNRFFDIKAWEDTNRPVDGFASRLGIPRDQRFTGKIGQSYDLISPHSEDIQGPFSITLGSCPISTSPRIMLQTDGLKNIRFGKPDDVTKIDLSFRHSIPR